MKALQLLVACVAMLVLSAAGSASAADWHRAETPRFIVYSNGDPTSLREAALELELYDSALRFMHGLDVNAAPARKLSIYLVRDTAGLRQVSPDAPEMMRGFYRASNDEIFAIAIRERRNMRTLLHEYAHHFMLANFASGYPSWLVEGYAEYFGTADIDAHQITIGLPDPDRQSWLSYADWLPLRSVLEGRPSDFNTNIQVTQFYGQSWMLTHWFMSDAARLRQLVAYAQNLQAGMDPVEAIEDATGMSVADLERTLKAYAGQRVALKRFSADQFARPNVEITTLSPGAGDLLLASLRLNNPLGEEGGAQALGLIRAKAARYPGDPFVETVLARAEIDYGDPQTAEAVLQRRLAANADDIDALMLLARIRLKAMETAGDNELAMGREARNFLARAYQLDPNRYQILYQLGQVRQLSSNYPTDNDMASILTAYDLAPQVGSIRFAAARAHLMRREYDEGITLLEPLANDPHSDGTAAAAKAMIARAVSMRDGTTTTDVIEVVVEAPAE